MSPIAMKPLKMNNTPTRQQIITNFTPKSKPTSLTSRIPYFFSNKWDSEPSPLGAGAINHEMGSPDSLPLSTTNVSAKQSFPQQARRLSMSTNASPSKSHHNVIQMLSSPYSPKSNSSKGDQSVSQGESAATSTYPSTLRHNSSFKFQSFLPPFNLSPRSPEKKSDSLKIESDASKTGTTALDSPTESSDHSGKTSLNNRYLHRRAPFIDKIERTS